MDTPMTAQPGPAQPGEQGTQDMTDQQDGGFTVCIRVDITGQLSVGVEQEGGASTGVDDEPASYRPAADRKEALTMALELLKNGGHVPLDEADQQFSAGFMSRGSQAP